MSKLWPKLIEYAERVNEEVGMIPSLLEAQSMAYKALGKLDKVLEVDKSIYSMKDYQPKRNILFDILLAHYALEDYQQVFDTATEMIRKGKVEKNIRGFDVISFLEGAYEQTKNHGKIIELCQLYLQTNPLYHRNCLLLLFQVYFNIGKYNKAEKYLQIILQNEPDNITALEQLVSIALVNGDKDLTIESGIKLVKLKPTYFADNDDLKTILKDHGIWDKIAPYAKFEAESPASGSDVEEAENELPAVSVLQEQSSSVSSSTQPSEIPAPSMASSTKADGVTSLQASSESTFQPAKPALPKVEEQQKPGQWVKKVAPKVVRRDSLTQASSSAVVSILKRSPSKESLRDKDKQTILEYMKQAFKKEGDALAKKLLDILPKLGLGPSYQKELRKVTREPKKELKEESKEQSSIPKPNDPDVYAIDGGKLYVKLDYHKVKEQAEEWHRGKSDSIMQEIVATLEKARNARDYGQSGIKYLSATTVELKLTSLLGRDIRVLGEIREASYQNKQGETVKYQYAILSSVESHKGIARGVG
jgi:tetratricopeptide (TPR) repeat protein